MRRALRWALALCLLALAPAARAAAETLMEGVAAGVDALDLSALEGAAEDAWLPGGAAELVKRLASGQAVLTGEQALGWLASKAAGALEGSLWRMTRLLAPALMTAAAEHVGLGRGGTAARYAGLVIVMSFLVIDLREYVTLTRASVDGMASLMQAVFPILTTLLAAVGGTAASAFYQPAVMAAAGSMTTLVSQVTMPLAVSVAALTMVGGLSDSLRVTRLCRLFRQAADWTLGLGLTVFIGVMSVQGLGAAAVDGVSIRTAKYAMDNFIPIVGGMFADTVDTLVGCSLLIQNSLGVLGLLLLLGKLLAPLLRTLGAMLLYRAASALLEPMTDSPLGRAIGEYAEVFTLLMIVQMSVAAMFLLLVAQLLTVGNLTVMLR